MQRAFLIAALAILMAMLFLSVDAIRARSAPRRAKAVRVGDTRAQVRGKMGRPSAVTEAGIFNPSETWAYGGYLDWQHLASPLRLRIFGPNTDEVAIRFDGDGKVSKVIIPK